MNGQGPGIWIYERDASGARILVTHCANEPADNLALREQSETFVPLVHGIASWVLDDGQTFLCRACGDARRAEEARQARLRRLAPEHRAWLEQRGVVDWRPR